MLRVATYLEGPLQANHPLEQHFHATDEAYFQKLKQSGGETVADQLQN